MEISRPRERAETRTACCGSACHLSAGTLPSTSTRTLLGAQRFRIANMDCASEENEIRHALRNVTGIHDLQFNLGDRELAIAADDTTLPQALEAIRKAGGGHE